MSVFLRMFNMLIYKNVSQFNSLHALVKVYLMIWIRTKTLLGVPSGYLCLL